MPERDWFDFGDPGRSRQPPPGGPPGSVPPDPWSGFGAGGPAPSGVLAAPAGPSQGLLVAGLAAAVAGVVAVLLAGSAVVVAFAGWLLCGPVAIGLTAMHVHRGTRRRAAGGFYAEPGWVPWLYRATVVVALAGVVLGALWIADWAARL